MRFCLGYCLLLVCLPFAYSYPCACILTDGVYLKSGETYKSLEVGKCYRYYQDSTTPILKIQTDEMAGFVTDSPKINKTTCNEESNSSLRIVKRWNMYCYSDKCRRCKCHPAEEGHCFACKFCHYMHLDCSKVPHSPSYNAINTALQALSGSNECYTKHCHLCHCYPNTHQNCGNCNVCQWQLLYVNCANYSDHKASATQTVSKTTHSATSSTKVTLISTSTHIPTSTSTPKPTTNAPSTTTVTPHWISLGSRSTHQPKWITVKG